MADDLRGRVAIVTGTGTGIGAATARALADRGADVVVASRTLENLQTVADEISAATGVGRGSSLAASWTE